MTVMIGRRRRAAVALATIGAFALLVGACGKAEETGGTGTGDNAAAAQQTASAGPGGGTCTLQQYGGQKIDLKTAKVGFSQSEKEANPFRTAETKSIQDEAAKLGITNLTVTNADSKFNKQIADVEQMIDQGVQLLVVAPLNSDGWDPVFQKAAAKKIPIITIDRKINAKHCTDAILLGAPGNNVTTQRTAGFKDEIAKIAPNIKIDFEQTGNFSREEGQKVAEQLLQSKPSISGVYAENDEMALGAVTALKGAGRKAGDVKIVSIDGTRSAVQGIIDGWIYGVVESNPRFGPLAFQTATKFFAGETVNENIIISDREYDQATAKDGLAVAY
jgi:ABC-type sugar transport system substrate-binding protein